MRGNVQIAKKPDVKPVGPKKLEPLKTYRVVEVEKEFEEAEVGDIVLSFPCKTGGVFIFNCTRQMMFFDKSSTNRDWDSHFQCLRAFDIRHVTFYADGEDKPHG